MTDADLMDAEAEAKRREAEAASAPPPTDPQQPPPAAAPPTVQNPRDAMYARLADILDAKKLEAAQAQDRRDSLLLTLAQGARQAGRAYRGQDLGDVAGPVLSDTASRALQAQRKSAIEQLKVPMDLEKEQALTDQAKAHAKYWEQGGRQAASKVTVTDGNRESVIAILSRLDPGGSDQYAQMPNEGLESAFASRAQLATKATTDTRVGLQRDKMANTANDVPGLSDDAIDQAARQYLRTGKLPSVGRGRAAPFVISKILNRASAIDPTADLAGNSASYKADTGSLNKQQQLLDLTESWESTGKANLGVLLETSRSLANSGSPLANKPLRWIYENAAGDPTVSKFKAARSAVVNEYAKILSGSTGSAGVTEGARHEAEDMIPYDATPQQIEAAASILESDAGNRLTALRHQADLTRSRTQGPKPAAKPASAAPTDTGADTIRVRRKSDGKVGSMPASNFDAAKYEKIQ